MGCQPDISNSHRQIKIQSPTNDKETGFLVRDLSDEILNEIKLKFPEIKVRVIYPNVGLYELFNVSEAQLESYKGQIKFYKNHFFKSPKFQYKSISPSQGLDNSERLKFLRSKCSFLDQSNKNKSKWLKDLEIEGWQGEFSRTYDLSQSIFLSTRFSKDEKLDLSWFVRYPETSLLPNQFYDGYQIQIQSDSLGALRVQLFVTDSEGSCESINLNLVITENEKYKFEYESSCDGPYDSFEKNEDLPLTNISNYLKSEQAWNLSTGRGEIIAIIDSGVNYNHPSLFKNLAFNNKEIPNNLIDDDGNGFIDDHLGYDFVNQDSYPFDDQGHGTHITGIIHHQDFGVAKDSHYIPIKAMSPYGGDVGSIIGAIYYAIDRGAKIINLSFGTMEVPHPLFFEVIEFAEENEVIIVTASGNGDPVLGMGLNIDEIPIYPASMIENHIITVASVDVNSRGLSIFSNFGPNSVDVAAFGGSFEESILSTSFKNPSKNLYTKMHGTSMAAPQVAGAFALAKAITNKKIMELNQILSNSSDKWPHLKGQIKSEGVINLFEFLKQVQSETGRLSQYKVSN